MKKGFTLIELLAVIVILAIIALIATPIILNVIEDAKKGAARSSVLGYIDAVEKNYALSNVQKATDKWQEADLIDGTEDNCYLVSSLLELVKVKGDKPSNNSQICLDRKHRVITMNGIIKEYAFSYVNNKVTIGDKSFEEDNVIDASEVSFSFESGTNSEVTTISEALDYLYDKIN